jgi:hypothetical protein
LACKSFDIGLGQAGKGAYALGSNENGATGVVEAGTRLPAAELTG